MALTLTQQRSLCRFNMEAAIMTLPDDLEITVFSQSRNFLSYKAAGQAKWVHKEGTGTPNPVATNLTTNQIVPKWILPA